MLQRINGRGFTLIETLVVVTILAIGLAIAIPNFTALGRRNSVKAEARELKNLLARTRMDAVRRNESLTATINVATNSCTVSDADGVAIATTNFDGVQLAININPPAIVWNNRGMTTNACRINLVGQDTTYDLFVSSAGAVRIEQQ